MAALAHYGDVVLVQDASTGLLKLGLGAQIAVFQPGTQTPVALLTKIGGAQANPFTASATTARYDFYLTTEQPVDIQVTLAGYTTQTFSADPTDVTATDYLLTAARGAVNGVASLDSSTLVPTAQQGTGAASSSVFLRGDRTWATAVTTSKFRYGPGFPAPVANDLAPEALVDATTTTVSFQAKRTGGTGATVDILKNGVTLLTTPLSLTTTAWTTGSLIVSPNLAATDTLQATVLSITGGVTLISTSFLGTQ